MNQALVCDDADPIETREWLEALEAVLLNEGPRRADYLLNRQFELGKLRGFSSGANDTGGNTPYLNSLPARFDPGESVDFTLERRIESLVRWNALAMVQRANRHDPSLGGHVASFASAATLYEVGLNHFFHAGYPNARGDLIFFQGHSSPGIYARAFLEGRLDAATLDRFRQEARGGGLSSYPHPWLMPEFWQFPTVSMGLGAMQAIYQARLMKYLEARGLLGASPRKVWCFLGDGEMDEPESTAGLGFAGRERLDNLIFVVNCNLQRLDGPVRGNGKIIQELERLFLAAGWRVIKVIWSGAWDALLARDRSGLLLRRMEECVDGEYQALRARDGSHFRQQFFGKYPELLALVSDLSDEQIFELTWGGHDPQKVYSAYRAAVEQRGQPTVVLAKTIKGFGMGKAGEACNVAHQAKKLGDESLQSFVARFELGSALDRSQLEHFEYLRPPSDTPEMRHLAARRAALGGSLPKRTRDCPRFDVPKTKSFETLLEPSGQRPLSTTKAFVQLLSELLQDETLGPRLVPIVADEARTFGMEPLFRRHGIWAAQGQLYVSEDAASVLCYREDARGQILQEGINEAGAMCSWLAAATAYANHGLPLVPFYIFYSMFGVQRTGDLWWAAGDSRARGFLLGATSGRTTLNGEGLQHEDGHSHVWAAGIPNCIPYDPSFAHEVALILERGLERMLHEQEDVFYYITLLNESYPHPGLGQAQAEDVLRGMYLLEPSSAPEAEVELLGSGAMLREVIAARELLERDFGIAANVWSCPSFTLLARDGQAAARWNLLHPGAEPQTSHVARCLAGRRGPSVAATDYVRAFAEQIRAFVPHRYVVLGTDGFGRSDTRQELRRFFEVDRHWIALAALSALADEGRIARAWVIEALERYQLDPQKRQPTHV